MKYITSAKSVGPALMHYTYRCSVSEPNGGGVEMEGILCDAGYVAAWLRGRWNREGHCVETGGSDEDRAFKLVLLYCGRLHKTSTHHADLLQDRWLMSVPQSLVSPSDAH